MVEAYRPASLKEAFEILSNNDCTVYAGGTDLMVKKRQWSGLPPSFNNPAMFISDIEELTRITKDGDCLDIGAACTIAKLLSSSLIPEYCKTVFEEMASPSIRNMATLGGNICNSSPAGDSLPLLYAADASVIVENSFRWREIPIMEFITGPGKNILGSEELLTAVRLPLESFNLCMYKKVGARKADAISKISFVALARRRHGILEAVRIAFGAAAPVVIRCKDVEAEIITSYNKGMLEPEEIIRYYAPLLRPIDDQRSTAAYRKMVCLKLLKDFLLKL